MATPYQRPAVADYGTVASMTQASGFVNEEDGGNKLLIHHVQPSAPAGP